MKKKKDLADTALGKILEHSSKMPEIKQEIITVKRHITGVSISIDRLYDRIISLEGNAKCKTCYQKHGWLTKCECENKT